MEPVHQEFEQIGIFVPNPATKRGTRVAWHLDQSTNTLAYCTRNNIILRNIKDPHQSKIINGLLGGDNVTCVTMNAAGQIAFGNEKGHFRVLTWNEAKKKFDITPEAFLLKGEVADLTFT